MLLQSEPDQRAGGIVRALMESDVPAIVALRQVAFRHSERGTVDALAAFFRAVFVEGPWKDPELPSLVYENERGDVAGFLGVLPRRMTVNGQPIRVAVGTQLMVSPGDHGAAGRRLTRTFIDGPQDLSFADTANDAARRLWESVGGFISPLMSLTWVRRLRPWRSAAQRLGDSRLGTMLQTLTAGLCDVLDRRAHRAKRSVTPFMSSEPLTAATICEDHDDVLSAFTLRPAYEPRSLAWLLSRAGEKRAFGTLHSARVRDAQGRPLGWYLYYLDGSHSAYALQIAARKRRETALLQHLFNDAWTRGAITVSGRMEPWLMAPLLADDDILVTRGAWTLLHSRNTELAQMIERGAGYLSRLDGEWWLSF